MCLSGVGFGADRTGPRPVPWLWLRFSGNNGDIRSLPEKDLLPHAQQTLIKGPPNGRRAVKDVDPHEVHAYTCLGFACISRTADSTRSAFDVWAALFNFLSLIHRYVLTNVSTVN